MDAPIGWSITTVQRVRSAEAASRGMLAAGQPSPGPGHRGRHSEGGAEGVAAKVYRELVGFYGFSARAAETYSLHAEQDVGHGGRQIEAIRRFATEQEFQEKVRQAVRLGVTAYTLEWDGHVQAMTGQRVFWSGVAPLKLRQPRVRLPEVRRP